MDPGQFNPDKVYMRRRPEYTSFATLSAGKQGFLQSYTAFVARNRINLLLGGLFLAGTLAGALLVRNASPQTLDALQNVLGGYIEKRQSQPFFRVMAASFYSTFLVMLILFFCGFCSIAQPVIAAVPFFKGLGYGFSIGLFYAQQGTAAMRYVAVFILPIMLLNVLLIIYSCRASLLLSTDLFRSTLMGAEIQGRIRIQRYCAKFIVFAIGAVLISILDAVINARFQTLFVF